MSVFAPSAVHIVGGIGVEAAREAKLRAGRHEGGFAIEPGEVAIAGVDGLTAVGLFAEVLGIAEDGGAVPFAFVEQEQAKTGHGAGVGKVHVEVSGFHEKAFHANGGGEFFGHVEVEVSTGGAFNDLVEQCVWRVVIGPAGSGGGFVGEAGGEGAIGVGSGIVQTGGHGEVMPYGDAVFSFGGERTPSRAEVFAGSVAEFEQAILLGQSHAEGGECFSGRCPVPDAVLGEVAEVLFEYNFAVFEDDEGFGVFLVEVAVEAIDIGIAPSQTLG